jgi:hypothetical protein
LRIAEDAVVVRSDGRRFDETVAAVADIIREREGQGRVRG